LVQGVKSGILESFGIHGILRNPRESLGIVENPGLCTFPKTEHECSIFWEHFPNSGTKMSYLGGKFSKQKKKVLFLGKFSEQNKIVLFFGNSQNRKKLFCFWENSQNRTKLFCFGKKFYGI
jgi:hypothetical protein